MSESNYVGILQEKCAKAKVKIPKYIEYEEKCGDLFRCSCTMDKWSTEGNGTSKKFAKHKAARLMLSLLEDENYFESGVIGNEISSPNHSVSLLYEYCQKENKTNPLFSDKPEEDGKFVIECTFNGFSSIGKASVRKKAKEISADNVLKHFNLYEYFKTHEICVDRFNSLKNSVSKLYETCQTKKLNVKFHEAALIIGKKTMYEVTCIAGELETKSSQYVSKKDAKAEAARLMLNLLEPTFQVTTPPESPQCGSNTELNTSVVKKQKLS